MAFRRFNDHRRARRVVELRASHGLEVDLSWSRSRGRGGVPLFGSKLLERQHITVDCLTFVVGKQQILPQSDQVALSLEDQYLFRVLRFVVVAPGTG